MVIGKLECGWETCLGAKKVMSFVPVDMGEIGLSRCL